MRIRGYIFLYIPLVVFIGYILYPYINFKSDLFIALSIFFLTIYNVSAIAFNAYTYNRTHDEYWNYSSLKLFLTDVENPMFRLLSIHLIIFILVQIHMWFDSKLTIKID